MLTFAEWCQQEYPNMTKSAYKNAVRCMDKYVIPYIGDLELDRLSGMDINRVYVNCQQQRISDSRLELVDRFLYRILESAVEKNILRSNPCEDAKRPVFQRSTKQVYTEEEQSRIRQMAQFSPLGNMYLLVMETGMRVAEVSFLSWEAVDLKAKKLELNRIVKDFAKNPTLVPIEKGTIVYPLNDYAIAALKQQKKIQEVYIEKAGARWHNPQNLVFTKLYGTPFTHADLTKEAWNMKKRTRLKDFNLSKLTSDYNNRMWNVN